MRLPLNMSLLLKSYAGFISRVASYHILGEEVSDFLHVVLFPKCMTCHCLFAMLLSNALSLPLCHAFVKCFILVFKSIGSRKTFHENISYCPQCRGVILGFCIEKEFVQLMLNFLGAITTRHALLGLMQK